MKTFVILIGGLVLLAAVALYTWRMFDHLADGREAARLLSTQRSDPPLFSESMVADLPEPARRYFAFTILEGTPLYTVAEITMEGQFGQGGKENPGYAPMRARQVLAAPEGFLWKMSAGDGVMRLGGSDSGRWTRFWLAGLVPVARAGGTSDHSLSAFGRYIAEAIFWTPAAVLPGPNTVWEPVSDDTARVNVRHDTHQLSVDVTVDDEGRPVRAVFQRWSNANEDAVWRLQPFGGEASEFREFDGFRLPTHVEAGNLYGSPAYYPFIIAEVSHVHFPD